MDTTKNKQPVIYLPFEKRVPDTNYHDLLAYIMKHGEEKYSPFHKEKKKRISGYVMRFNMKNGFPIITERRMSEKLFKGSLGEIIGFANGARTLDQLEKYGCPRKFWERWVTAEKCADFSLEPGDLGPASYGPAWTQFPTHYGYAFNQIKNIQRQIREFPNIRTHYLMPLIPYMTCSGNKDFPRQVVVAPCHGSIQLDLEEESETLTLIHTQASADVPVGLPNNIMQYAGLGMMFASSIGYEFKEYVHVLLDAHIYERQYIHVEEMLTREPRKLPTVTLLQSHNRIEDFRVDDFNRSDYNPHPPIGDIDTPI